MMKTWLFFSMFSLAICVKSIAQIDTEFWFAAPDLEAAHAEQPICFVLLLLKALPQWFLNSLLIHPIIR